MVLELVLVELLLEFEPDAVELLAELELDAVVLLPEEEPVEPLEEPVEPLLEEELDPELPPVYREGSDWPKFGMRSAVNRAKIFRARSACCTVSRSSRMRRSWKSMAMYRALRSTTAMAMARSISSSVKAERFMVVCLPIIDP